MSARVMARSISRPLWEQLHEPSTAAAILAVFERACVLVAPAERVLTLVLPELGDGPLNIVLDGQCADLSTLKPRMPCALNGQRLQVGPLVVTLEGATVWEPRPDWPALRAHREACLARLPLLQSFALQQGSEGSLLSLLDSAFPATSAVSNSVSNSLLTAVWKAMNILRRGWKHGAAWLQEGAAQLAGLGVGLTPAGDDFLSGVMLGAWLTHAHASDVCRVLAETAAPRTTVLSGAFLRAAARGECGAAWHRLLAALSEGREGELSPAVEGVLAYGATSGADALAGFLWAMSKADA